MHVALHEDGNKNFMEESCHYIWGMVLIPSCKLPTILFQFLAILTPRFIVEFKPIMGLLNSDYHLVKKRK
jgi:hypothetical protein